MRLSELWELVVSKNFTLKFDSSNSRRVRVGMGKKAKIHMEKIVPFKSLFDSSRYFERLRDTRIRNIRNAQDVARFIIFPRSSYI